MALSEKKLKDIAFLARIDINEAEIKKVTVEINNVLNLMANLSKIDTSAIQPMAHPLDMLQKLREDDVIEKDDSKKLQKIAPKTDNNYFLVPKVIE